MGERLDKLLPSPWQLPILILLLLLLYIYIYTYLIFQLYDIPIPCIMLVYT